MTAFAVFLIFYGACVVVTYAAYLRKVSTAAGVRELAYAGV